MTSLKDERTVTATVFIRFSRKLLCYISGEIPSVGLYFSNLLLLVKIMVENNIKNGSDVIKFENKMLINNDLDPLNTNACIFCVMIERKVHNKMFEYSFNVLVSEYFWLITFRYMLKIASAKLYKRS